MTRLRPLSEFSTVVRGFLRQYVSTLLMIAAEIGFVLVVTRRAGIESYGTVVVAIGIIFIVFQLFDFRATESLIRFGGIDLGAGETARFRDDVAAMAIMEVLKNVVVVLVAASTGFFLAGIFGIEMVPFVLVALYHFFFYSVSGTARAGLRLMDLFSLAGATQVIAPAVRLFLALAIPANWLSVQGLGMIYAMSGVASFIFYIYCLSLIGLKFGMLSPDEAWARVRDFLERHNGFLRFAKNMLITSWSMIPTKELDVVILGSLSSPHGVGLYKLAKNLLQAITVLFDSVQVICLPVFTRMIVAGDSAQLWRIIKLVTVLFGSAAFLIYGVGWFASEFILSFFIDEGAEHAAALFRLMSLGLLVWGPLFWISPFIIGRGRAELFSTASLLGMCTMGVLYFALGWLFHAEGLATATALSFPITLSFLFLVAKRARLFDTSTWLH